LVELAVLFGFLFLLYTWLIARALWRASRNSKQQRALLQLVEDLRGRSILVALDQLGPPEEQFMGSTGRSLCVWKAPPTSTLPAGDGLLIFTLVSDDHGTVEDGHWHKRGG
jgi:hypothetical protein